MDKRPPRRRVYHPASSSFASPKAVVQQHMKNDADINTIVARAKKGIVPSNIRQQGVFADVSNLPQDLTEAFSRVENALDLFGQLPAKAREELGNDPRRLSKAPMDFFVRHGLATIPKEAPGDRQEAHQGSGGGRPPKKEPKAPKAPQAPTPDQDDQE